MDFLYLFNLLDEMERAGIDLSRTITAEIPDAQAGKKIAIAQLGEINKGTSNLRRAIKEMEKKATMTVDERKSSPLPKLGY